MAVGWVVLGALMLWQSVPARGGVNGGTVDGGTVQAAAVVGNSVVLPCSFTPHRAGSTGHNVQWNVPRDDGQGDNLYEVHAYYFSKDQLGKQSTRFNGRTAIFASQLAAGNASLKLTAVTPGDAQNYKCYVSTSDTGDDSPDAYTVRVNLAVTGPVQRVDVETDAAGDFVCNASGLFPRPTAEWTGTTRATTAVKQAADGTFSLVSRVQDPTVGLLHVCTVTSGATSKNGTWSPPAQVNGTLGETLTLQCQGRDPVWRFDNAGRTVSEEWRRVVGNATGANLTLDHPTGRHRGTYTCRVVDADGNTRLETTEVALWPPAPAAAQRGRLGLALALALFLLAILALSALAVARRVADPPEHLPMKIKT